MPDLTNKQLYRDAQNEERKRRAHAARARMKADLISVRIAQKDARQSAKRLEKMISTGDVMSAANVARALADRIQDLRAKNAAFYRTYGKSAIRHPELDR